MKRTKKALELVESESKESKVVKRASIRGGVNFEHNLAIGMIVDTEFLEEMREEVQDNLRYIRNKAIKQIVLWCLEYYDNHGKAPHLDIQDIFEARREQLSPADGDIIENFLLRLSGKYEQIDDFDGSFQVEQIRRDLEKARLEIQTTEIHKLLKNDRLEEPQDLVREYQESLTTASSGSIFEAAMECVIPNEEALRETKTREPRPMLWPWLASGQIVQIFAERGVGKTWLGLTLAVALTRENYEADENSIGPWKVRKPCGVLYVDGEMGNHIMKKRILQLATPRGPELRVSRIKLITAQGFSHGAGEGLPPLNITNPEWQRAIYKMLKNNMKIRVLILDNLSSLMPGVDENIVKDWSSVNEWLLSIRSLGRTVIFLHHAGKSGIQRGTSGREDHIDYSIRLAQPKGHEGPCTLNVSFTKQRHYIEGAAEGFRKFSLRLTEVDEHRNLNWETPKEEDNQTYVMAFILDGESNKNIVERIGCSESRVSQLRKKMKGLEYMTDGGKSTPKGREWRNKLNLDDE